MRLSMQRFVNQMVFEDPSPKFNLDREPRNNGCIKLNSRRMLLKLVPVKQELDYNISSNAAEFH